MNVVIVTPRFAPDIGGVETYVMRLGEQLALAGHHIQVVTSSDRTAPGHEVRTLPSGAEIEVWRSRRWRWWHPEIPPPGFAALVHRVCRGADVVHVHSYHALVALIAAVVTSKPLVATLYYHGGGHTVWRRRLHRLYRPLGCFLVKRCQQVIAVSGSEATLLERDFSKQLAAPPMVVPNGTDTPVVAVPHTSDVPVVLSVCRLEPYKRVDVLVEARRVASQPWRLVVVGDGPSREELTDRQVPGVEFLGRIGDHELARWWSTAQMVVSASEEESFGLTVAQALNSGVHCVVSNIPAHRELVDLAGCGHVVDGDDPRRWAGTIETVLDLPRPAAAAFPDWKEVAASTVSVYRDVTR